MIFNWLRRNNRADARRATFAVPAGLRVYAVGDVHGALIPLEGLQARIIADISNHPVEEWLIVYLGDYIDRGDRSRDVIDRLLSPPPGLERTVMLRGNHEQTLLDCLADPERLASWREFGGVETLLSYGVDPALLRDRNAYPAAVENLRENMPAAHLAFFQALPCSLQVGDYYFCHAGVRPGIPLDRQSPRDLMWIREEFLGNGGDFGGCVVHGHTPVAAPELRGNRINVDTGACMTGRLTCVVLEGETRRFLTT